MPERFPLIHFPDANTPAYNSDVEPVPLGAYAVKDEEQRLAYLMEADAYQTGLSTIRDKGVPVMEALDWSHRTFDTDPDDYIKTRNNLKLKSFINERAAVEKTNDLQRSLDLVRIDLGLIIEDRPDLDEEGSLQFEVRLIRSSDKESNTSHRTLFHYWKEQAEQDANREMSWFEWLSLRPEEGGATNEQLLNIVQWNEQEFRKVNQDPATKEYLRHNEILFKDGLETAVANGSLSPLVIDAYRAHGGRGNIYIGDALDQTLISAAGYVDRGYMVLSPGFSAATYMHERSHTLGRLGKRTINEGATDTMAKVISDNSRIPGQWFTYERHVPIIKGLLELSGMTTAQFSEYFVTKDDDAFFDAIQQSLGVDLRLELDVIKQQILKETPDITDDDLDTRVFRELSNLVQHMQVAPHDGKL